MVHDSAIVSFRIFCYVHEMNDDIVNIQRFQCRWQNFIICNYFTSRVSTNRIYWNLLFLVTLRLKAAIYTFDCTNTTTVTCRCKFSSWEQAVRRKTLKRKLLSFQNTVSSCQIQNFLKTSWEILKFIWASYEYKDTKTKTAKGLCCFLCTISSLQI